MKKLLFGILLLVLISIVQAQTLNETFFIEQENITLHINIAGVLNQSICEEETVIQEDICGNISFTDLPLVQDVGKKISFGFTHWQEGDSVTYWVEDLYGTILKDKYTTTSNSKKSYTPKLEGAERGIIFYAIRERTGCEDVQTEHLVLLVGEETALVCEEQEPVIMYEEKPYEETITSLYVRAQKWQEEITLYGNVQKAGKYLLFGKEVTEISLDAGSFSYTIHPQPGENTYGLVLSTGSIPKTVTFTLTQENEEITIIEESIVEENNTINSTLSIPPTGQVILDTNTSKNTTIIAGLTGIAGLGVALSTIKTKLLRRKQDSA